MAIKHEKVFGLDVIWYAVDLKGHVAQFTTGGCSRMLEHEVLTIDDLDEVVDFFEDSEDKSEVVSLDNFYDKIGSGKKTKETIDIYMEDFISISKKGLYVYDANVMQRDSSEYFKVCYPTSPIVIDELPDEVQRTIKEFKVDFNFDEVNDLVIMKDGIKI